MTCRPLVLLLAMSFAMTAETPWPVPVAGHVPLAAGEHPRLFLRRADLPALKARWAAGAGGTSRTRNPGFRNSIPPRSRVVM